MLCVCVVTPPPTVPLPVLCMGVVGLVVVPTKQIAGMSVVSVSDVVVVPAGKIWFCEGDVKVSVGAL